MAKLATIGLSEEQAVAVASMLAEVEEATAAQAETAAEASRAKARARVQRWRDAHPRNVTERNETLHGVTKRLTRAEDRNSSTQIEPQEKKQTAQSRDVDEFRASLSPDVPFDLISEFIKVRRKKRGAITKFAASLFREDAAKCGMSVADAARECVRSSWITVKPEYFAGRQRAGPVAATPQAPSQAEVFKLIRTGIANGQGREDSDGVREAVPNLPAVRTG